MKNDKQQVPNRIPQEDFDKIMEKLDNMNQLLTKALNILKPNEDEK